MSRLPSRLVAPVALALVAAMPATVSAQQQGPYVGLGGGLVFPNDSDIEGGGVDTSAELDNGWGVSGSVGYRFSNGFRPELELSYRTNDVDSVGGVSGSGDVTALGLMGNLLYDIPIDGWIRPYIGVGAGVARLSYDVSPVGASRIDDDTTEFALQGIAGVAFNVAENLDLTLDYRYFTAPSVDLSTAAGAGIDSDYSNHMVMVGLRFTFGGPPPAAQPAAAPPPAPPPPPPPPPPAAQPAPPPPPMARQYLVFFDWDRADLTAEARRIIATAAQNAKAGNVVRLQLTGHADRSGPARYNMGLSQRRADAVKAELVRLGVPGGEIATAAKGETEPLVPTPDGVREPQNRRVEIVFP